MTTMSRPDTAGVDLDTLATGLGIDLAELTTAFDQAARDYLADEANPNTRDGYDCDWRVWLQFARQTGLPPLIVSSGVLLAFAKWHSEQRQPATDAHPDGKPYAATTIERRVMGVTSRLRAHHGVLGVPKGITADALHAIEKYRARMRYAHVRLGRGKAAAVWPEEVMRICAHIDRSTLIGKRDFALVLVWYYIGSRRSELGELRMEHITVSDEGLSLYMPTTKTGEHEPVVPHDGHPDGQCPPHCGVAALSQWCAAAGITDGHVFRPVDRHGNVSPHGMSGKSVGTRLTRYAAAVGLGHRTGHGMRRGHISTSVLAGKSETEICRQTGHVPGSKSFREYVEDIDRWRSSANGIFDGLTLPDLDNTTAQGDPA